MKLSTAVAITTLLVSLGCHAFEMKKFNVDTRDQFIDNDVDSH